MNETEIWIHTRQFPELRSLWASNSGSVLRLWRWSPPPPRCKTGCPFCFCSCCNVWQYMIHPLVVQNPAQRKTPVMAMKKKRTRDNSKNLSCAFFMRQQQQHRHHCLSSINWTKDILLWMYTQPIITFGGRSSWTNGATTKISVNYNNYNSQTKQSVHITERHKFQTLCTNTKNVETWMTSMCWTAAVTDVWTSTSACMCHTNVSCKDFWKIFTPLKVVKVNIESNEGETGGNEYTVPFLPVRNTHLTKGNLHIQDWLAAVI